MGGCTGVLYKQTLGFLFSSLLLALDPAKYYLKPLSSVYDFRVEILLHIFVTY